MLQGCHGQGKISGKWNFFQVREKSEICGWPGKLRKDLASQGKVREYCGWPGKFRKDFESQGILWMAREIYKGLGSQGI